MNAITTLVTQESRTTPQVEHASPESPAALLGGHGAEELLAPVYEAAAESASLIGSRTPVRVRGHKVEIPKFLLLGQRGGGKPIRLALLAGLDDLRTTAALARLLIQFRLSPGLAKDYALFAYPVVDAGVSANRAEGSASLEERYAAGSPDGDVQYFQAELGKWDFNGLVALRVDPQAKGFRAEVRSEVIGREVVEPALAAIGKRLPIAENAVTVRAAAAQRSLLETTAKAGVNARKPAPFQMEIFAPGAAVEVEGEQVVTGLFLAVQEVLRNYRRVISHAANL